MLVEGVEDALSVRVAGYKGPIAATLGKGGLKVFAPTCAEVVLVPDHDVGDDEILACVEFHVAGGRKVRVAQPVRREATPTTCSRAASATTSCRRSFGAAEHTSVMGDIIRDLAKYPFTPSGDTRFDYDLTELAKRHKVSRSTLQKRRREERKKVEAAEKARKEASTAGAAGGDDKRTVIEPSAEPVPPGPEVPDEVLKLFEDYVVAPAEGMLAATILWAMHTAEFERWAYTPRCYIRAPAHESGKTRLSGLIRHLVPNSQMLLRSSGPGLFRRIDALNASGLRFVPFIDEIDGIFHGEKDEEVALRAIFNNNETALPQDILLAHETVVKGARKIEARTFYALVPMLFSGLDILPATMQSRAISIDVFRATPKVRTIDVAKVQKAAARLRRWVIDNADDFDPEPEMPVMPRELSPRERDTWTPLVSIAKTIGGQWPELVRLAMLDAFGSQPPFNDNQYVLLDVRRVFDKRRENNQKFPDLISSADLAQEMSQQEHGAELFIGIIGGAGAAREQRLATPPGKKSQLRHNLRHRCARLRRLCRDQRRGIGAPPSALERAALQPGAVAAPGRTRDQLHRALKDGARARRELPDPREAREGRPQVFGPGQYPARPQCPGAGLGRRGDADCRGEGVGGPARGRDRRRALRHRARRARRRGRGRCRRPGRCDP